MSDFTADVSAPTVSAADVDVWAEWLCDIGYPFDISFPENPPPVNHAVLARLWNERDDWRISDDDAEACVRYEAGLTIADKGADVEITTAAELDALPAGTIVRDRFGGYLAQGRDAMGVAWFHYPDYDHAGSSALVAGIGPVTVCFTPGLTVADEGRA